MSIQTDTKAMLAEAKMTQADFAAVVGVNPCALSKFLNRSGESIAERIAPYVYGKIKLIHPSPTEEHHD